MINLRRRVGKDLAIMSSRRLKSTAMLLVCALAVCCAVSCRRPDPEPEQAETEPETVEAARPVKVAPVESLPAPAAADESEDLAALQEEIRQVEELFFESSRKLVEAEDEARRSDPDVRRLYEAMMASHAEYKAGLDAIEEIRTLREENRELHSSLQELLEKKRTITGENTR